MLFSEVSIDLLKTDVDVISMDFCNGTFSYDGSLENGTFCAGQTDGGE